MISRRGPGWSWSLAGAIVIGICLGIGCSYEEHGTSPSGKPTRRIEPYPTTDPCTGEDIEIYSLEDCNREVVRR